MGVARSSLPLLLGLAVAAALAWTAARVPAPLPADAPADAFSAARAGADIARIAQRPHPTGSAEAARVRELLVARLRELGLPQVEVQEADVAYGRERRGQRTVLGGRVQNVIGVLPGADPAQPAVLLMAHYDTVPGSPGAADDSLGVAAILEILRALGTEQDRQRDLVALFTDGEEAGLLGAHAFFGQHPLRDRIGFAINLEARGSSGRAMMFETAPGNGATIARYAQAAPRPVANSLMGFVYRHMPNGTDFSVAAAQGIPGLNFAISGMQFDYHAPSATPAHLDPGSVQHLGDEALAAARALVAGASLPQAGAEAVYSDLYGRVLVVHGEAAGWPVLAAALALIACVLLRAHRLEPLRPGGVAAGFASGIWVFAATALVARAAFRALGGGSPATLTDNRVLLAKFGSFAALEALLVAAAVLFLLRAMAQGRSRHAVTLLAAAAAALCSLHGGFDALGAGLAVVVAGLGYWLAARPRETWNGWAGLLLLGGALGLAAQALAPALTPYFVWPLLPVALAGAVALSMPASKARAWVLALGMAPGLAHLLHFGVQLFVGVGYGLPEILAPVALGAVIVSAPLLMPLAAPFGGRLAGVLLAAAAVLAALILLPDFASPRHPRISQVFHVAHEAPHRHASALPVLDAWTRGLLGAAPQRVQREATALPELWETEAPPSAALPPTRIALEPQEGAVLLRLLPPPGTRELRARLRSEAPVSQVGLAGRTVPLLDTPGAWSQLRWQAPPAEGLVLRLETPAGGELEIETAAFVDAWPADLPPLPPRDAQTMPWGFSDGTLRLDRAELRW